MIYFDNAASGFYKPSDSIAAAEYAIKNLNVNAGRSAHRLAVEAEKEIFSTRKLFSKTFNNGAIDRVIFTTNCSAALNYAIFGLPLKYGEIVTSVTEHNSVLRPLMHLKNSGVKIKTAKISEKPFVTAEDVLKLVTPKTDFVVLNAASNVTGYKNEYAEVGRRLKDMNIPLVVDGAQAGGHAEIDMQADGISCLCLAGHKGLMGIQGAGVLIFDKSVEIAPILFGGSGTESFLPKPTCYPELLEAGTLALPAIMSLKKGLEYVVERRLIIRDALYRLTKLMLCELKNVKTVRAYSEPNPFGIVSFSDERLDSAALSAYLSEGFDIATRGGFHFAPLMHKALGTEIGGLLRVSFSHFNREEEISSLVSALKTF